MRDDDTEWLSVDSSCVRATVAAAGAKKKADGTGGQAAEALGRSRGGFGSKIHAVVNSFGQPVKLQLTGSEAADSPHLPGLIAGVTTTAVLADKGYDSDANREAIRQQGAEPCIPSRKNRKEPIPYDRHLYGARPHGSTIERETIWASSGSPPSTSCSPKLQQPPSFNHYGLGFSPDFRRIAP